MSPDEPVAYLGGEVLPPAALPGTTAPCVHEHPLTWEEDAPGSPATLPWRDIEALLERVAPEEVRPSPAEPMRIDPGGRWRLGVVLALAACLLIGAAAVLLPASSGTSWVPWEEEEQQVPVCLAESSEERLKTAMLKTVRVSERKALGLDAPL